MFHHLFFFDLLRHSVEVPGPKDSAFAEVYRTGAKRETNKAKATKRSARLRSWIAHRQFCKMVEGSPKVDPSEDTTNLQNGTIG